MSYTAIQYTADDGNVYQVNVPSDFATALGQSPATSQPSLPPEIAVRYANFRAPSGAVRQAMIDTLSNFGPILGSSVTVGGVAYNCTSSVAQKIPIIEPIPSNGTYFMQGPAGSPGPPGVASYSEANLNSDQALSTPAAFLLSTGTLPAGTYLMMAKISANNSDSVDREMWAFFGLSGVPQGDFGYQSITPGSDGSLVIFDIITLSGGTLAMEVWAAATGGGTVSAYGQSVPGTSYATRLITLLLS